VVLITSVVVQG